MKRMTTVAVLGMAGLGGVTAYRIRQARRPQTGDGQHAITVNLPLDEVTGRLPSELTQPAGAIEVTLRPAPGGRGTEIRARALGGAVSDDQLRKALRNSRSLLEVGDVLEPGGPTTTPTVLNGALRTATRHGREEGLL
jgi:hypothetical protein